MAVILAVRAVIFIMFYYVTYSTSYYNSFELVACAAGLSDEARIVNRQLNEGKEVEMALKLSR
jgi:hypothetical protein